MGSKKVENNWVSTFPPVPEYLMKTGTHHSSPPKSKRGFLRVYDARHKPRKEERQEVKTDAVVDSPPPPVFYCSFSLLFSRAAQKRHLSSPSLHLLGQCRILPSERERHREPSSPILQFFLPLKKGSVLTFYSRRKPHRRRPRWCPLLSNNSPEMARLFSLSPFSCKCPPFLPDSMQPYLSASEVRG